LDGGTGNKKWGYVTTDRVASSPVIGQNGTVYVGSSDGAIYALDGSTGNKKWGYVTTDSIDSSPAIGLDRTIYVSSSDGTVFAFNSSTGAKKWGYITSGKPVGSPVVGQDGTVYVGTDDGTVYAIDGNTGNKKWASIREPVGSPVIGQNTAYISSEDGRVFALNSSNGNKKWSYLVFGTPSNPVVENYNSSSEELELIVTNDKGIIYYLKSNGDVVWSFSPGYKNPSAIVANVDDDEELEIIANDYYYQNQKKTGVIYVVDEDGIDPNPPLPNIEVGNVFGGSNGVSAKIKNTGVADSEDVSYFISVKGGILGLINVNTTGSVESVEMEKAVSVKTNKLIFGIGRITVTVGATDSESEQTDITTLNGFIIGRHVFLPALLN
jgi:outer membrane protein assembly factor BamB